MTSITSWRYVLKTLVFTFFLLVVLPLPAYAVVMTFAGGTGYYDDIFDEGVLIPCPGPEWQSGGGGGGLVAYEENGLYLEIGSNYEVRIKSYLEINPPFQYLNFSLTSDGHFNLDSLDLIAAFDRPYMWLPDPDDLTPPIGKDVQFLLTASNNAGYIFPTSSAYQYAHLNFGNLFHDIDFFTITVSGYQNDQSFIIDNVSVTPVPEPASRFLFALGMAALCFMRARHPYSSKSSASATS